MSNDSHKDKKHKEGRVRTSQDINKLREATESHIADVERGMNFIADQIQKRGSIHDHTKKENLQKYFDALNSPDFRHSGWRQFHSTQERHHLKLHAHHDVNLIDVIEHVVDCTVSGMVRSKSGHIRDTDISPAILIRAIENTVELIKKNVPVGFTESSIINIFEEDYNEDEDYTDLGDEYIEESANIADEPIEENLSLGDSSIDEFD